MLLVAKAVFLGIVFMLAGLQWNEVVGACAFLAGIIWAIGERNDPTA